MRQVALLILSLAACTPSPKPVPPKPFVIPPLVATSSPEEPDAGTDECAEGATSFEVISTEAELFSFVPRDGSMSSLGKIECLPALGATPFSMAIDRKGTAYVLFGDERLFRIPKGQTTCEPTPLRIRAQRPNGMGFVATPERGGEALFMTLTERSRMGPPSLGVVDTKSFTLTPIATFKEDVQVGELTGTREGKLYMLDLRAGAQGRIREIDRDSAAVKSSWTLPLALAGGSSAMAAWRGDFFLFTAPDRGTSTVHRFRPGDGSLSEVVKVSATIVGAGVSTCARD